MGSHAEHRANRPGMGLSAAALSGGREWVLVWQRLVRPSRHRLYCLPPITSPCQLCANTATRHKYCFHTAGACNHPPLPGVCLVSSLASAEIKSVTPGDAATSRGMARHLDRGEASWEVVRLHGRVVQATTNDKVVSENTDFGCSIYVVPGSWGRTTSLKWVFGVPR